MGNQIALSFLFDVFPREWLDDLEKFQICCNERRKNIKVKLFKFRWYGLILVESLEAMLNDNYKEIDIQPIKTNEFLFELEQIKLTDKSKIKINPFDFKMKSVPLEVKTNVKSLSFKGLNSEI